MTHGGVRVVIVDDHDRFRTKLGALLSAAGWDVVGTAADGASAVSVCAAVLPDLVVLDIMLGEDDGFAIAERLVGLHPAPKVVLTSAYDASTFGSRVATAPVAAFVPKAALSPSRLLSVLGVT